MANEAAQINDGDVFSIKITEPYDSNYETMVGIAQRDQNENKHFDFLNDIENFDEYNVVYIGMPVWWGKLPQPMVSFFEKYDFSGKTIVPFGIHLGSHFGSMVEQIKELEPNAEIKDGFTVSADVDNEKVKADFSAYIRNLQ
ncbi:MAG: flavodoxin [Firmicutes bacterium]|nr:flavodoxin [Bacillota bacterium]